MAKKKLFRKEPEPAKKWANHDWEKIFRKKRTMLTRPRDFDCLPNSMALQVRRKAGELGYKVSVKQGVNEIFVEVE